MKKFMDNLFLGSMTALYVIFDLGLILGGVYNISIGLYVPGVGCVIFGVLATGVTLPMVLDWWFNWSSPRKG